MSNVKAGDRRMIPHINMDRHQLKTWREQQPAARDKDTGRGIRWGWTQQEAADWYGVGKRAWQRWEGGERGIPLALLKAIIRYDTSYAEIVDRMLELPAAKAEEYGGLYPELAHETAPADS